jgi:uncharacterized protein
MKRRRMFFDSQPTMAGQNAGIPPSPQAATMNQDLPHSPADPANRSAVLAPEPLSADEFDEIDTLLDELRTRYDETPQWEFCEGFMAALICCRRAIAPTEYLPVLLAIGADGEEDEGSFADGPQAQRFMELWMRRWNEIAQALNTQVTSLDDEAAYHPEVMDVRGAIAALPEEERAAIAMDEVPSFAQVWALGFMFAVESWPEEWAAPRDKEAAKWLDRDLQAIVALTEDDTEPATLSVFDDDGPPSVSLRRLNAFADAIWAVYELHELWRNLGPRVETVRKEATPGRNDPCFCGSGKKYKKCHGAT